jgi:phosphomannomutase
LPPTDGLRYRLDGSKRGHGAARVVVRPSGTEPKLKCYLEVVTPVGASVDDARTAARVALKELRDDLATTLALG